MAYSIHSIIEKNQLVSKWLHLKHLSDKLNSVRADAELKVSSESESNIILDSELENYANNLTAINDDLSKIHDLRKKERELEERINKAEKRRKKIIKLAVISTVIIVVVIGVAVAVSAFMKSNDQVEQVEEDVVIENLQK